MSDRRRTLRLIAAAVISLGIGATLTYAVLPPTDVSPTAVPLGTLAGATPLNVLSIDAFIDTISHSHGSNAVLQHIHLAPGQATGWHTHPGPNVVLIEAGSLTLMDDRLPDFHDSDGAGRREENRGSRAADHCTQKQYKQGEGFVTGLEVHQAIAGPDGVDFYGMFLLPKNADVLRVDATAPAAPSCTSA